LAFSRWDDGNGEGVDVGVGELVAVANFVGVEVETTTSVALAREVFARRSVAPHAIENKPNTQIGNILLKRIMGRLYLREDSVSML